jgi:hypothetical protein
VAHQSAFGEYPREEAEKVLFRYNKYGLPTNLFGKGAAKSKHAAQKAAGVKTSETRKAGPKKIAAGTTSRVSEK